MPSVLMAVAAVASVSNPLLGKWVGERPGIDAARIAARNLPTMTITRDAISFRDGAREVGVAPIAGFDLSGKNPLVRTRFGEVYRFRFIGADRMCRMQDAPLPPQCFSRSRAGRA